MLRIWVFYNNPWGDHIKGYPLLFFHSFEEMLSCFVMNVFCGYFTWLNGPNFEVIFIIPIFGVLFSQNLGIRPLGLSYRGLSPSVLALIFKKSHYTFPWWIVVVTLHDQMVICIISISGVIFGHNLGIAPPPGIHI